MKFIHIQLWCLFFGDFLHLFRTTDTRPPPGARPGKGVYWQTPDGWDQTRAVWKNYMCKPPCGPTKLRMGAMQDNCHSRAGIWVYWFLTSKSGPRDRDSHLSGGEDCQSLQEVEWYHLDIVGVYVIFMYSTGFGTILLERGSPSLSGNCQGVRC